MKRVVVIPGDGIGPEVIECAMIVLRSLDISLDFEFHDVGETAKNKRGTYLPDDVLDALVNADACLFGALTTPVDPDYRSPLLEIRRSFDLYANVRPIWPLDVIVIRENTEGIYVGDEDVSDERVVTRRIITRKGAERVCRFALNYAMKMGRRRITCVHKANVLMSDRLFLQVFREHTSGEVRTDDILVDTAALKAVQSPRSFDVILAPNLYGDILSDLLAGLAGGIGLIPSGSYGSDLALFEPVHGSAPDIAGRGMANPCGAILSAAMMLEYLGFRREGEKIWSAVRKTVVSPIRTPDIGGTCTSHAFTYEVISQLDA